MTRDSKTACEGTPDVCKSDVRADLLFRIEQTQRTFSRTTPRTARSEIGQFLTPAPIAEFMASLFEKTTGAVRMLDPGAGTGSLFATLTARLVAGTQCPESIEIVAYENDPRAVPHLQATMQLCREMSAQAGIPFQGIVHGEDFIVAAAARVQDRLFRPVEDDFTHVILNPPYKKINGETATRRILSSAGIETSNLYAAFVWLAASLTRPGGEIVAITPRSFCNGPYFRRFRKALLALLDLRHVHTFESRKEAFADDLVLQENIIFHGVRNGRRQGGVRISVSKGPVFTGMEVRKVPFREVVVPDDPDAFIHLIESDDGRHVMEWMTRFQATLADLGLEVSTGRVVDFRAHDYLRQDPEPGTVPLLYPCHFADGGVQWPLADARKPNAIVCSPETEDLLVPTGHYVLTKRFTAKEERRRIVSVVYDPTHIDATRIGFENHLNYFHAGTGPGGLTPEMARGLALFLNSSMLDRYFRLFSGHTQVNATDLRKIRYPSREQILRLGRGRPAVLSQGQDIDTLLAKVCPPHE